MRDIAPVRTVHRDPLTLHLLLLVPSSLCPLLHSLWPAGRPADGPGVQELSDLFLQKTPGRPCRPGLQAAILLFQRECPAAGAPRCANSSHRPVPVEGEGLHAPPASLSLRWLLPPRGPWPRPRAPRGLGGAKGIHVRRARCPNVSRRLRKRIFKEKLAGQVLKLLPTFPHGFYNFTLLLF